MKEKRQDSLSPNLRKYYEARQEMNDWLGNDDVPEDTKATMYAQQLQRVNQLKNQVFRPEPSPAQMILHTEQTMTSESDSTAPSQQLNATDKHADYRFCSQNDAKSCKITNSEIKAVTSCSTHKIDQQETDG